MLWKSRELAIVLSLVASLLGIAGFQPASAQDSTSIPFPGVPVEEGDSHCESECETYYKVSILASPDGVVNYLMYFDPFGVCDGVFIVEPGTRVSADYEGRMETIENFGKKPLKLYGHCVIQYWTDAPAA